MSSFSVKNTPSSSSWLDALRMYADKHGKFIIPRKGSSEYDEIKSMVGGAYSADSIRCTDKAIRVGVRGTPGECFQRGKKVGYRAGITKGEQPPAPVRPDIEGMTLRALGDLARQNNIRGYSNMRKAELVERLLEIYPPV